MMVENFLIPVLCTLAGNTFLGILKLLYEIDVRRKNAKEKIGQSPVLHFGYYPFYTWIGFFGTLVTGSLFLLMLAHQSWTEVLCFLPWVCLFFALWYYMSGQVIVDDKGITLKKFGWKTFIRYEDITTVTYHNTWDCVVIRGGGKRIQVEYQLDSFEKFERAVNFYLNQGEIPIDPDQDFA
jgi:hypothetical protein